jgi:hypothetical protein
METRVAIEPPLTSTNIGVIVDWLELAALASQRDRVPLYDLQDQLELEQEQEPDDWSDEDQRAEDLMTRVCTCVEHRRTCLGDSYPFVLSEDGAYLCLREAIGTGGVIYLFVY